MPNQFQSQADSRRQSQLNNRESHQRKMLIINAQAFLVIGGIMGLIFWMVNR